MIYFSRLKKIYREREDTVKAPFLFHNFRKRGGEIFTSTRTYAYNNRELVVVSMASDSDRQTIFRFEKVCAKYAWDEELS